MNKKVPIEFRFIDDPLEIIEGEQEKVLYILKDKKGEEVCRVLGKESEREDRLKDANRFSLARHMAQMIDVLSRDKNLPEYRRRQLKKFRKRL